MVRPECLTEGRYNLPSNERHIPALHFSRNGIDWCMAGLAARGDNPRQGVPTHAFRSLPERYSQAEI